MYDFDDGFDFGPRLWDADPGVCCAAFQLGACSHTESYDYEETEMTETLTPLPDLTITARALWSPALGDSVTFYFDGFVVGSGRRGRRPSRQVVADDPRGRQRRRHRPVERGHP